MVNREKEMPRRAYSYARISRAGKQAKGRGVKRQTDDWVRTLCDDEGWTLDDTLTFVDKGKSGFHKANLKPTAALGRFLSMIGTRVAPGSVLVVENLDRLSRAEVGEAYDLFRSILKAGVWIATREPRRIYKPDDESGILGILEPLFIFARGNEESSVKSMRVNDSWASARKHAAKGVALPTRPPFWLEKRGSGYDLKPDMVAVMLRLHTLARTKMGLRRIRRTLEAEGIRCPTRVGVWSPSVLSFFLKWRAVLGEYRPFYSATRSKRDDSGPAVMLYPAIMKEEDFLRTQAAIGGRKNKSGRPAEHRVNLFTGLVYDERTGLPLRLVPKDRRRDGKLYVYLATRDGGWAIPYLAFEACVLDTLAMLRPEDVVPQPAADEERERRIADLTGRIVALAHRKEQLQTALSDPEQDAADLLPILASIRKQHGDCSEELNGLKMESLTGRAEALAEAMTLRQMRDGTDGEERRTLDERIQSALPTVVSRITVNVQHIDRQRRRVDVRIALQSGGERTVVLLLGPK